MRLSTAIIVGLSMASVGIAQAADSEVPELTQPMQFGDAAMRCPQIIKEVVAMETRLGGDPSQSFMDGEQVAGIGTGLAQRAAISAGAGGAAIGAIGKVGGFLGKSSKKKKAREAQQRAIAEKRWLYLAGLYQGKACDAQLAAMDAEEASVEEIAEVSDE